MKMNSKYQFSEEVTVSLEKRVFYGKRHQQCTVVYHQKKYAFIPSKGPILHINAHSISTIFMYVTGMNR
jgi:hypothetical protein